MSLAQIEAARPATAIVLGSGMGSVAECFEIEAEAPYSDVPGLGVAQVPGHAGRFLLARLHGQSVLIAQGRRHIYEGLSAYEVTAGIRFMHSVGVRRVLLTNAAGAIDPTFAVGGLMIIGDHLNLQGQSPLKGPQFVDMTTAYSAAWRQRLQAAATRLEITLPEGVYAAVLGPQYETPAEIRMLRAMGAQAVGMSTAPEVIQARALGMEVAAISLLTNWAAGLGPAGVDHLDVLSTGAQAASTLAALVKASL